MHLHACSHRPMPLRLTYVVTEVPYEVILAVRSECDPPSLLPGGPANALEPWLPLLLSWFRPNDLQLFLKKVPRAAHDASLAYIFNVRFPETFSVSRCDLQPRPLL